jgi:putative transposase
MARQKREVEPLPTIWRVTDELWADIQPILNKHDPPKRKGRKRVNQRDALDAIIFRMRSGVQWNHLPKELPDDSSVHRTYQRWLKADILGRIWAQLAADCDQLGGLDWEWQAADGWLGKARLGGTL